eukprot:4145214-Pleurochrysis_carterae.AAC.4
MPCTHTSVRASSGRRSVKRLGSEKEFHPPYVIRRERSQLHAHATMASEQAKNVSRNCALRDVRVEHSISRSILTSSGFAIVWRRHRARAPRSSLDMITPNSARCNG